MRRSVVVQRRPDEHRRTFIFLALAAIILFGAGLVLGRYGSLGLYQSLLAEKQRLETENISLAEQQRLLQQELENQRTKAEVSDVALAMVRAELAEQNAQLTEMEQGVRFYRSLMGADEQPKGLSVRSIDIAPTTENGNYQFQILVQQNARKHGLLTGVLNVDLLGIESGVSKRYGLYELSDELPAENIKLRFKYFQAIDGEIRLPEGFEPRKMVAYAKATQPRQVEVEKDFPWSVQEKISHVGN